jgi:glycosyltransferase involved in cell wall biosynthesis
MNLPQGASMPSLGSGVRVFPELRAAHLEEIDGPAPRRMLYFARKYDLGDQAIPSHCVAATMPTALSVLWRSDDEILELPELLWLRFLPRWLLLATVWKLRRLRGIRRSSVVFFAIENNSLDRLLIPSGRAGSFLGRIFVFALRLLMGVYVSRCAFGTDSAASTYRDLLTPQRPTTRITLDLLSSRLSLDTVKEPLTAIFVGLLEERKGIQLLLDAWPDVEAALDGARLRIVGDGPLRSAVEQWIADRPEQRIYEGMLPRSQTLRLTGQATALIAPSLRDGRWREQVGRPIQEALAVGTTVVTTSETGLASWLKAQGHHVVDPTASQKELATSIIDALRDPLDVDDVLATLPARDGRITADNWLHQP